MGRPKVDPNDRFNEKVIERFNSKTNRLENGCLVWTATKDKDGYGRFQVGGRGGKKEYAHRWALEYSLGGETLPEEIKACHHCDNPSCVNPAHLFLGTNDDNVKDKVLKNRAGQKLTAEFAKEIKNSDEPTKVLMERYGVGKTAVNYIRSGETWKHI